MDNRFRKTFNTSFKIQGIGLHSGKKVTLTLHPEEPGHGISFLKSGQEIPVAVSSVVETANATTIGMGTEKIQTIEHLMSSIHTLGITDCTLEIDATEVPIMDGSAKPFVDAILSHGMKISDVPNPPLKFEHPLWVVDGDKYLILLPGEGLKVTYHIDFPHPLLKGQTVTMNLDPDTVLKEILPARTFGFLKDVESLQSRGLALGGSIDNAVVLTDSGFLNDSLRYENECVRHKVLDLIGDLALVGRPLTGHLIAYKAGHALDVSLARCIQEKIAQQESTNIRYFRKQNISSG